MTRTKKTNTKKKAKNRISTKQRLLKIYVDLESARNLQLKFQEDLSKVKAAEHLLHDSAMIGHFLYEASHKIELALK